MYACRLTFLVSPHHFKNFLVLHRASNFFCLKAQSSENTDTDFFFFFFFSTVNHSSLLFADPHSLYRASSLDLSGRVILTTNPSVLHTLVLKKWAELFKYLLVTFPVDKFINNHLRTEKAMKCSSLPLSAKSIMARAQLGFDKTCFLLGSVNWH